MLKNIKSDTDELTASVSGITNSVVSVESASQIIMDKKETFNQWSNIKKIPQKKKSKLK